MRALMIIAFLCLSFSNSSSFAQESGAKARTFDTGTTDTGPIGAIFGAVKKMDDWIQNNLW